MCVSHKSLVSEGKTIQPKYIIHRLTFVFIATTGVNQITFQLTYFDTIILHTILQHSVPLTSIKNYTLFLYPFSFNYINFYH